MITISTIAFQYSEMYEFIMYEFIKNNYLMIITKRP